MSALSTPAKAEIKVESFSFTRYGLIHGTGLKLSRDAVRDDQLKKPAGPKDAKNEDDRSQQGDGSPGYTARIALEQIEITTENGPVALGPGMAVTAKIKTGRRRVISCLRCHLCGAGRGDARTENLRLSTRSSPTYSRFSADGGRGRIC